MNKFKKGDRVRVANSQFFFKMNGQLGTVTRYVDDSVYVKFDNPPPYKTTIEGDLGFYKSSLEFEPIFFIKKLMNDT